MSAPGFFATPGEWRAWLQAHHQTETELSVGFWKKDSGQASITWPESVDEALCFGWIDGVRHRIDNAAYRIRFTPRKAVGIWSQVNIRRFAELQAEGRVMPAGQAAFDMGKDRTKIYSYERDHPELSQEELALFQANNAAWINFHVFPPGYRKIAIHRVVSAKGAATRLRRLSTLVEASALGLRLSSPTQIDQ
jgi:uncharacterized protein YdeI (YjbR/CyaY-like superfamily)